jgi:hypothetical protein
VLVVSAALTACAGATLDTALEVKDEPRHPDGVLVEPPPALPQPEERGKANDGVLALRQPITNEQISDLVHRWIKAHAEDYTTCMQSVDDLLDREAVMIGDNNRTAPRINISQLVMQRNRAHRQEYAQHGDLSHTDKLVRWSYDDLGPRTDPARPAEMKPGDVYVHVPVDAVLSTAGDPLFRATLVLIVRRSADHKLRFAALGESDLP